jgi:hypothetical protein
MASKQWNKFDRTMRKLISVPHDEIKAKLEAEKAKKNSKKAKEEHDSRDKDNHST